MRKRALFYRTWFILGAVGVYLKMAQTGRVPPVPSIFVDSRSCIHTFVECRAHDGRKRESCVVCCRTKLLLVCELILCRAQHRRTCVKAL